MRLEPQNVCRPVPQPWEAPALCSHGHGVRRCSQKTKNNHCFAGSWLSSLSLLCGRVQRGGRLGTGGVPPRGPTGHVHEVSPQQPWGGVLSLKDSPRQHPQHGLGKGQGQRSHILQRLEPATQAEEGKGEARHRKPEARGRSHHARPPHKSSPATGWCPYLRSVSLTKEAQGAGCVSEHGLGAPAPASAQSGGPGELAMRAQPSPPSSLWLWDLSPPIRTVGGAQTTGARSPLARSGVLESVSEKPLSCFLWRPLPCTHHLPTRSTATHGSKSTRTVPGPGATRYSHAPPRLPPPREVPSAEAGPRDGE